MLGELKSINLKKNLKMNNNLVYSSNPAKKASFITKEGKFINLVENKFTLVGYEDREPTHVCAYPFLKDEDNLIRLNDGTYLYISEEAYVDLPKQEPTKEQYDALLKWFDFLMLNSKKEYVYLGFSTRGKKFKNINRVNKEGLLPEELINEVKKLYKIV